MVLETRVLDLDLVVATEVLVVVVKSHSRELTLLDAWLLRLRLVADSEYSDGNDRRDMSLEPSLWMRMNR